MCVRVCVVTVNTTVTATPLPTTAEWITDFTDIVSKFSLRTADVPDDDMCYIVTGRIETINECEFNSETQTFIVIHGWTVRHSQRISCKVVISVIYSRKTYSNPSRLCLMGASFVKCQVSVHVLCR